jgi:ABC-2 type transport system ATP-binding protein
MDMLTCKGLSKEYDKGKRALDGVSFSIPAKGVFALIGRNGAGKTTLVRILATQLLPTGGYATLAGLDVVKDTGSVRELIACVPQEAHAMPWLTPRQFITSYLYWRGMGRDEAARSFMATMRKLRIEKYADTTNRKLSGGLKRKVLVAAVIASRARILFLDEPTTGLDPISRTELWETLRMLKKDHFIFLTTHYLEEAENLADNIGILNDGRLMALGTLDELRARVKYPYSIKVFSEAKAEKPRQGSMIVGEDGVRQILTTEREANRLSTKLIKRGVRLSMNPITLEDIFYYIVKKPIENEVYDNGEEYW